MHKKPGKVLGLSLLIFAATALNSRAQLLWTVGADDNGWPQNGGPGPDVSFVQENGSINPLPGDPFSPAADQQADNDYYFAGIYTDVIQSVVDLYGAYDPVQVVTDDEIAAERAFAGGDNDLRYHFNLPDTLKTNDLLSITFDAVNLDTGGGADPRYGIEVYFNGVLVQPQIIIRPGQLDQDFTTPQFSLAKVNAQVGPGFDNIVSLKGINYLSDGGGNWMGIDYVQLNHDTNTAPPAVFPWQVGANDGKHITTGTGGGTNTVFVQESGSTNALPGNAKSAKTDKQADDDYYFAGSYTTNIASVVSMYGSYQTIGLVATNEESAERAFATGDNERRYHFNLPSSISPSDRLAVTFDPLDLDTGVADPHYGVEIYVNGVRVQPEVVIHSAQLNKPITTAGFTASSVNAKTGPGFDNIVTLRGISHSGESGGNWMGIDYVRLDREVPAPTLPWFVGQNDNGQPTTLSGGGANAAFVQENGSTNALPGDPNSPKVNQKADDDYYLAGIYSSVIPSNGSYTPVGVISANEEAAERAFAGQDNFLRYHFNLPSTVQPTDRFSIGFDPISLDTDNGTDARYGIEVYFNNVLVQTQLVIRADQLNVPVFTAPFTAASVNAQPGVGYDNIVTLKGINYGADGGGNWMGLDYIELTPVQSSPFPWMIGKDDNGHITSGTLGGPDTAFVQENGGSNPLPGDPYSPDVDRQADDDYYFAGTYTNVIQSVAAADGDYTPVGSIFSNEAAAERAFAGSDNTRRYHFNLPASLKPTDQLLVTVDFNNQDASGGDPHYGFEVYFNEVQIQPEVVVTATDLDKDYSTPPFTLASVNAQVGPGYDNFITLKGINHSDEGGGQWMGIDYIQINAMPGAPVFPWQVGSDDNRHITSGSGGGTNTAFVQENGSINDLPGNPHSRQVNGQADNDYYFAGVYSNTIPSVAAEYGDYTPVGIVPVNEEAAERAFAGADNDLRYHFNLPASLSLTNQVSITYDPLDLDTGGTPPQYGIMVFFNGVQVQDEVLVHTNDLGVAHTTAPFTLASVNAQTGPGADNIVSLQGVNYSADGGGNWMGIDYVRVNLQGVTNSQPATLTATIATGGKITINWTGSGSLESAPAITGPWTPVTPAPANPPYTDTIVPTENRFYRLKQP